MTLASPKFRRPRKPYRPRKTAPCYLLSCACSLLGNSVAGVILPLVLLATTGDALAAGPLALICAVPQFVIGLIGGALTDRFNRRNVSIVSDILSAASVALLPVVDMVWGLSFGWFVALGLLGAIGDIPGMTARDSLVPAVCERDGRSLQKFMGLTQSLDSLVVIVGPALAAFLMGAAGSVNALWFTAAMSLSAALITLTLPRSLGAVCGAAAYAANPAATRIGTAGTQPRRSLLPGAWNALRGRKGRRRPPPLHNSALVHAHQFRRGHGHGLLPRPRPAGALHCREQPRAARLRAVGHVRRHAR